MNALLLLLCLAPQAQNAEAKKLLDALAPPLKDPAFSQVEYDNGTIKGVCFINRIKAWRIDTPGLMLLFDGKGFLHYSKKRNDFHRSAVEPQEILLLQGGPLAEIHYSGNADRFLKEAKQVTVKKEKLNELDCTHVVIARKDAIGTEWHLWIDPDQTCVRAQRKWTSQGKGFETTYIYKVVDPPAVTDDSFTFQLPADARKMSDR